VSGIPKGCQNVVFGTFDVGLRPLLVDRDDRYNSSELAARFQIFVAGLYNEPNMTGYILAYSSRRYGQTERNLALVTLMRIATFLKIDISRLRILDAGFREDNSIEFWMVPPGATEPIPTPSIDQIFLKPKSVPIKKRLRK